MRMLGCRMETRLHLEQTAKKHALTHTGTHKEVRKLIYVKLARKHRKRIQRNFISKFYLGSYAINFSKGPGHYEKANNKHRFGNIIYSWLDERFLCSSLVIFTFGSHDNSLHKPNSRYNISYKIPEGDSLPDKCVACPQWWSPVLPKLFFLIHSSGVRDELVCTIQLQASIYSKLQTHQSNG